MSENGDKIEYYSEPYDSKVEIVLLNTCGFISSGREEMFQTIDKLLKAKKKICLIGCGVQYFEKVVKSSRTSESEVKDPGKIPMDSLHANIPGFFANAQNDIEKELQTREKILENENISYLSRNDLTFANIESLTKRSQNFDDYCRYSAPRLLTNYENRYEYLKIAE